MKKLIGFIVLSLCVISLNAQQFFRQEEILTYFGVDDSLKCRYLYLTPIGKIEKSSLNTINAASGNVAFQMNLFRPISNFICPISLSFNATSYVFSDTDSTYDALIFPESKQRVNLLLRPGFYHSKVLYSCFPVDLSFGSIKCKADSNSIYFRKSDVDIDFVNILAGYQFNKYFRLKTENDICIFSWSFYYSNTIIVPKLINKSFIKNDYYSISGLNNGDKKVQMNFAGFGSKVQFQYKTIIFYVDYKHSIINNKSVYEDILSANSLRFGVEIVPELLKFRVR